MDTHVGLSLYGLCTKDTLCLLGQYFKKAVGTLILLLDCVIENLKMFFKHLSGMFLRLSHSYIRVPEL